MNESTSDGSTGRSWFERIGQALSGEPQDREALVEVLRDAERRDLLSPDALTMIEGAIAVGDMHVRDIMVPRAQMVSVPGDRAPEDYISEVIESGHSRFPVIGDNRDEVEGILLAKDLLAHFASTSGEAFNTDDTMRPAVFIPESKRLNVLLREFRASRNHMAIVVDEYGGVAGLVTIEDVLEQIVGEIDDEHDTDEGRLIKAHRNGEFTVKARATIGDFNEFFGTDLSDVEFDTIGGLVVQAFGHMPARGESVRLGEFRVTIIRADKRRLLLLRFSPVEPEE